MALSFFDNKQIIPTEDEIVQFLDNRANYWNAIVQCVAGYGTVKKEFKCYSKSAGWCMKVLLGEDRNIVFLYPGISTITAVLVFSQAMVHEAVNSDIPQSIKDAILAAKQYKEGRSFQLGVDSEEELENLKMLISIKVNG